MRSVPAAWRRVFPFPLGLVVELTGLQSPMETWTGEPSRDGVRGTAALGSMSEEGGLGSLSDPVSVSELLDRESQSTLVSQLRWDCIAGARASRMRECMGTVQCGESEARWTAFVETHPPIARSQYSTGFRHVTHQHPLRLAPQDSDLWRSCQQATSR